MKIIWIVTLALNFSVCNAQSTILYNLHNKTENSQALDKIGVVNLDNDDYVGSPFLEKEFLPTTVKGENGTHLLRYNVYQDEIVLKKDEEYFKVPKEGLEEFNFDNKYKVVLIKDKYYVQVSDRVNKYSVVKKESVRFINAKASENGYDQAAKAKFVRSKPDYYLYDGNTSTLTPFKKSDLEQVFATKKDQISTISKKIKLKTDEDYKKFFQELMN